MVLIAGDDVRIRSRRNDRVHAEFGYGQNEPRIVGMRKVGDLVENAFPTVPCGGGLIDPFDNA